MPRPDRLVAVVGTGTDVGKTFVAVGLLRAARATGARVAARKPVQSYSADGGATDADVLAGATGDEAGAVCPRHRWYETPMAPPMAAELLGRPAFTVADLAGEVQWTEGTDLGLVETAGGVRSPIASDGDSAALARAAVPDAVVLVADAGLGTINAVRLSCDALDGMAVTVVLNRFRAGDELHERNREWLAARDGYDVAWSIDSLLARLDGRSPC
jgi:dethiobiotin synthetase